MSHDQVKRFISERPYTSKGLWCQVKPVVRQIEKEDSYLVFDDTIQEKAWTDENEVKRLATNTQVLSMLYS